MHFSLIPLRSLIQSGCQRRTMTGRRQVICGSSRVRLTSERREEAAGFCNIPEQVLLTQEQAHLLQLWVGEMTVGWSDAQTEL